MAHTQYLLEWIKREDRSKFISFLKKHRRQTMNARVMASAQIVKATYQGEIIGCGGIDIDHFKRFPEMFSLFVLPEFRGKGVGMALELARYMHAIQYGVKELYIRIESRGASSLLEYRKDNNCFTFVEPDSEDYTGLCRHCEYYQKRCEEQRFMRIDVQGRIKQIIRKIGPIDALPKKMEFISNRAN